MELHELWHVAVLASTLLGAAGTLVLLLAPLLFGETPAGVARARPLVVALVGVAGVILVMEWVAVH